jgi:putative restriction endonuclease
MPDLALETELRAAMLAWLTQRRLQTGGPISAAELRAFRFRGEPLPLLHPAGRGIHKPSLLGPDGAALTLLTAAEVPGRPRRYDDTEADDEGWFIYRYQGTDPQASDNRAVRRAMEHGLPLVYFRGLAKGLYEALYPAFIEHDDPQNLAFHVSMDTRDGLARDVPAVADQAAGRRYATRAARVRLHQSLFRERV